MMMNRNVVESKDSFLVLVKSWEATSRGGLGQLDEATLEG